MKERKGSKRNKENNRKLERKKSIEKLKERKESRNKIKKQAYQHVRPFQSALFADFRFLCWAAIKFSLNSRKKRRKQGKMNRKIERKKKNVYFRLYWMYNFRLYSQASKHTIMRGHTAIFASFASTTTKRAHWSWSKY